ncbi:MAG: preprotein translocase subunit YajC [Planctomycetota bacterium]|jgi:preprotein translocase subunit YajC
MDNIRILAQGEAPSSIESTPVAEEGESTVVVSDSNDTSGTGPGGLLGGNWIFIVLMFVLMYFILFRGPRKKQQEHRQMVKSLEKNDRVRTIGGIVGTVVDIKGEEITLKVDESTNTKIKIIPSAIGKNLSKESK